MTWQDIQNILNEKIKFNMHNMFPHFEKYLFKKMIQQRVLPY